MQILIDDIQKIRPEVRCYYGPYERDSGQKIFNLIETDGEFERTRRISIQRLMMELHLGRRLLKSEWVYIIDPNKPITIFNLEIRDVKCSKR